MLKVFNSKLQLLTVDESLLESYVGSYETDQKVIFEAGNLYLLSDGGTKSRLIALDKNLFTVKGADYYGANRQRVQFALTKSTKSAKSLL